MNYQINFCKKFSKFLIENEKIINALFDILKMKKKNITDCYFYTKENPPPHPKYKYPDKLYLACIIYIIKYHITWDSFMEPIPGKQINKRHHTYLRYDIYRKFFEKSLNSYLEENKITKLSIDSTIVNNKNCAEITKNLPLNKNRKGLKVSVVIDNNGIPISSVITESHIHDSKIAEKNLTQISNNKKIKEQINSSKQKITILADKAYDSNKIKENIKRLKLKYIIAPNNRRTKNPKLRRKLTVKEIKIYRKRIKIEHFFARIKKYAKINCVYEKKIRSYVGLIFLVLGSIIINRLNN
jgi:transposase